jgi:hypothetical protein
VQYISFHWHAQELLKKTDSSEASFILLNQAYEQLDAVNLYVNKHKFDKENGEKLAQLDRTVQGFQGKLQSGGRIYYRDATLGKMKPSKKLQPRQCFLFNDMLLYTKESGTGAYLVRGSIPTHLILVRSIRDMTKQKVNNAFQLRRIDTNRVYTFSCGSAFEKTEWLKDLRRLVNEQTEKQDHSSRVTKQLIAKEWMDES